METVRKSICIDESRSHRNGLLPFVPFDEQDSKICEVSPGLENGNYGQYVCDFVFCSAWTETLSLGEGSKGITIRKEKEVSRLKYLDAMRRYNYTHDKILNGIIVKKVTVDNIISQRIDCVEGTNENFIQKTNVFITAFEEEKNLYDLCPLDISLFHETKNGKYQYERPAEYSALLNKESLLPEEAQYTSKIDKIEKDIEDEDFFILIDGYDNIVEYNSLWDEWWHTNFSKITGSIFDVWEQEIFDAEYVMPRHFSFMYDMDKYVLGRIDISHENISGSKVPNIISYTQIQGSLKWFETFSADTITAYATGNNPSLIKLWEEKGGGEFYRRLKAVKPQWVENSQKIGYYLTHKTPSTDIPICLTEECTDEGMLAPYEYSMYGKEIYDGTTPYSAVPFEQLTKIGNKFYVTETMEEGTSLTPHFITFDGGNNLVDSKIGQLMSPNSVDIGNGICGIFDVFVDNNGNKAGKIFKCTFRTSNDDEPTVTSNCYQIVGLKDNMPSSKWCWWECLSASTATAKKITCHDGEIIEAGDTTKYRNASLLAEITHMATAEKDGDVYYFMIKFDNGATGRKKGEKVSDLSSAVFKTMKIPYVAGEPQNISTYDDGTIVYDKILSATIEENHDYITIDYAIGITSGASEETSGIHYEERFPYEENAVMTASIDGAYLSEIYYDKINLQANDETVYNDDISMGRTTRRARITGMEIGGQWQESGAVNALLFSRASTEGNMEEPIYNVSLEFNRGNAAAWENHFKLSECNTLNDLANYGNNTFNI